MAKIFADFWSVLFVALVTVKPATEIIRMSTQYSENGLTCSKIYPCSRCSILATLGLLLRISLFCDWTIWRRLMILISSVLQRGWVSDPKQRVSWPVIKRTCDVDLIQKSNSEGRLLLVRYMFPYPWKSIGKRDHSLHGEFADISLTESKFFHQGRLL